MRRQRAGGRLPVERPHGWQTAGLIHVQEPLHGGPRHARQRGDQRMGLTMRFEPEDFHPTLHQRIGMIEPLPFDLGHHIRGKLEVAHPCVLARWA